MANFDSRIYCNTFWSIFGTTKKVTKSGPSDPVIITKILQKRIGNILKNIMFVSESLKHWNCWKVCAPICLNCFPFWKLESLKFENLNLWNMNWKLKVWRIWNVENWSFKLWKLEKLKFQILTLGPGISRKNIRRNTRNQKHILEQFYFRIWESEFLNLLEGIGPSDFAWFFSISWCLQR